MPYQINHDYKNTADAVTQLSALEANVNALRIASNLEKSDGLTALNLATIFDELDCIRQTLLTLIIKTRAYVTKADTSLQAADAAAATQFLGAGN
jgi:hypothetical protein